MGKGSKKKLFKKKREHRKLVTVPFNMREPHEEKLYSLLLDLRSTTQTPFAETIKNALASTLQGSSSEKSKPGDDKPRREVRALRRGMPILDEQTGKADLQVGEDTPELDIPFEDDIARTSLKELFEVL